MREGAEHSRRSWTLAMLAMVAFLATLDRQAFVVLLVPVQQELQASDAAMGFLMGSAFALAQAVFTLPVGRWTDRANRRNLLAVAVAIWSLGTVFAGLAGSFVGLLCARLLVGAAESAQTPVTASLVGDLFHTDQRGSAFMCCSVGMAAGVATGSWAGGTFSDLYGWHAALLLVGAPGLLVALLVFVTVPEPSRSTSTQVPARATLRALMRQILAIRTLLPLMTGFALLQAAVMGWFVWFPVLLMRVHGLTATQMGSVFGIIVLCGLVSAMLSGPASDWLGRRGARRRLYLLVAIALVSIPLILASSLANSAAAARLCAMGFTLVAGGHHPVVTALYTSVAPPAMRGSVAAVAYLTVLLGAAASPLAFGAVNDALSVMYGDAALRYTLLLSPLLLLLAALSFWIARRDVESEIAAAEARRV